jgi:hypothetical protein
MVCYLCFFDWPNFRCGKQTRFGSLVAELLVVPTTLEVSAKVVQGIPERHVAIIDIPISPLKSDFCSIIYSEIMHNTHDAKQPPAARPPAQQWRQGTTSRMQGTARGLACRAVWLRFDFTVLHGLGSSFRGP